MAFIKRMTMACAVAVLLTCIFLQVTARPYDVMLARNSTQSVPQEDRDVINEEDFHKRIRRSLDKNPCYKPGSYTKYQNYYTVECYVISPTGCTQNISKYGTPLCRPIYTSYGSRRIIQDCACA